MQARDPLDADWRPGADIEALRARAELLAALRAHFAARDTLEVDTPLACSTAGSDVALQPIKVSYTGPVYPHGATLYLQTSPEFAMKRLLAAGSGPVYQICKAFRDGEAGRLHNPEFTILEWYRPGVTLASLIDEVADVARLALERPRLGVEHVAYAALFEKILGIDVFAATTAQLHAAAIEHSILGAEQMVLDLDGWLDLLFSHLVQPKLGHERLCFVTDYPASQAALARRNADERTAARFELFYQGIELANGFDELIDVDEQAARFEADNCARRAAGNETMKIDRRLLGALQHGMPPCVGVAVGIDRLLMLRLGRHDIDEVLSFSLQRA